MVFAEGRIPQYNKNMSFVYEALRDKPVALFMMDDTSPFQDYSGYGRSGSASGGTPPKHIALVNGVNYASVFGGSITGSFPVPVFIQGKEYQSFSLEAWVRTLGTGTSEQQILGNTGRMDGLVINGTVVSFVTKFLTAPEARVSYDLQMGRAVQVVGVHNADKNSLYINGELVGEVTLTEEQQADSYVSTTNRLYCGTTSGSQKIAVNALGVYGHALDQVAISRHHLVGRNLPNGEVVSDSNGGDHIPVSLSNSNLFMDQWWSKTDEWEDGEFRDTAVIDDRLVPQFDDEVSIPGDWMDSVVIETPDAEPIFGVVFNWDGVGAKVEVSIDDDNWVEVSRGTKVPVIPEGYIPGDDVLGVRVSFAGGIQSDTSYMDNLNAVGLLTATTPEASGRTVTFSGATQEREYEPLELHDNWGAEIQQGGTITISPDIAEEDPLPARTLELWIKATGPTNPSVSMTGTTYINGSSGTATLPQGEWVLMHVVSSTDVNGSITISGPAQVGQAAVYDIPLTSSEIASLYDMYTGNDAVAINDQSSIQITESAEPVKMYAHDWSIQASG